VNLSKWIGLLALIATVYILWCIRHVLLLLLVAIVLATLLNRLTRWFLQFGVKRSVAVALSVAAFLVTAIGFAWMIIPPFLEQFQNLIALSPQILAEAQTGINWLQDQAPGKWSQDVRLLDLLVQQAQPLLGKVADSFVSLVSNLLAIALQLVLIVVLAVMLLSNPNLYRRPFLQLFPAFYRLRADSILTHCEKDIVGWIYGALITAGVFSTLSGLGLWALGMPLVLVCALWTGFTELIPNIGYIVGMVPPVAIALLDAPWKVLPVIVLFFLLQQLEIYIVLPWAMKERVSLPPAVTILSQVVFATFFGALGLLLALPLMIITKIWLQELVVKDVLDQLKGDIESN